jgi:predicted permease
MLRGYWNDVRYAARRLRRTPGFTAAAILTIGLGVGVNTGIFSVLNGVLFRELPVPGADRIVSVYQAVEGGATRRGNDEVFSTGEYREYRDGAQTLAGLVGYSDPTRTTLGGESPQRILGTLVTCNYFDVLRQPPALGRSLAEADCAAGAAPVVVLSHDLWNTAFAADPAVLGRTVELNRVFLTVVGVAAPGTYGGFGIYDSAYFAPISTQPLLLPAEDGFTNDATPWLFMLGRRADGASLEAVRAELGVLAARIDAQEPGRSTTLRIERATPLGIPSFRSAALAIGAVAMTAFGLILLIACANVANLLLARGSARGREIAVRVSLGASRARVARQLMTESALLAVAGGAVGSIAAIWSFEVLVALALPAIAPAGVPPLILDASPDVRVLAVALALTLGAGVLFGLAPALQLSKPDLHAAMKDDAAGVGSRSRRRLQGTLLGAQVAFCMALSIGAALLTRGLLATQAAHPGF